jgi:hypothetical protein
LAKVYPKEANQFWRTLLSGLEFLIYYYPYICSDQIMRHWKFIPSRMVRNAHKNQAKYLWILSTFGTSVILSTLYISLITASCTTKTEQTVVPSTAPNNLPTILPLFPNITEPQITCSMILTISLVTSNQEASKGPTTLTSLFISTRADHIKQLS